MGLWLWLLVSCKPSTTDQTQVRPTDGTPPIEDTDLPVTEDTAPLPDTGTDPPTGTPVTDSYTYETPMIDVLFVIDASGSMVSKTETLIASLGGLVGDWEDLGLDYHVGVTNIDESSVHGHLEQVGGVRWADPEHPTPVSVLVGLVDAVGDPSSNESGRAAAYKALELSDEATEPNYGFLRDGSQIAIIVHTDETDQSGDVPISQQDFVSYLLGLRPDGDVAFHSIAATSDYLSLTTQLGGVGWSVDNTPYGPALQAIADTFHQARFTLSEPAIASSLVVTIIEPDQSERVLTDSDYFYNSTVGTVELVDDLPQPSATVNVDYLTPD